MKKRSILCLALGIALAGCTDSKPFSAMKPPEPVVADPGTEGNGDFTVGPEYTNHADFAVKENAAKGTVKEFTISSSESKLYPGIKGAYQRRVIVYVPPGYVAGTPAPVMIVQDGPQWLPR